MQLDCIIPNFFQLIKNNGTATVKTKYLLMLHPYVCSSNSFIAALILLYLTLSSLVQIPSSRSVRSSRGKHLSIFSQRILWSSEPKNRRGKAISLSFLAEIFPRSSKLVCWMRWFTWDYYVELFGLTGCG